MIARVAVSRGWQDQRLLGIAIAAILLVAGIYWQSFSRMVSMWSLADYQYGWLVYPISLYLLWNKRAELANEPVRASWIGVAVTAALAFIWLIARLTGVQVGELATVNLMPAAVFWAIAGTRALRLALFPLGLLLAGVPVGAFFVHYLQEITATISSALLFLAGVPAYREGMFLTLPGGSFEVAEACGGLRYVLAAVMASLAYASVSYATAWKRILFVMIAAVTMVVTNGVRAFIVMSVASATELKLLAGRDHVYFGMVLFAAAFVLLIWLGERHADRRHEAASAAASKTAFADSRGTSVPVAVAVLFFLVIGPVLVHARAQWPEARIVSAELPALPGCRGPGDWSRHWSPQFAGADRVARSGYDCAGHGAAVYFASYATQTQGKELVSSENRVWPHEWRRYARESVVTLDSGVAIPELRQIYVDAPDRSMLIWYWYQVGGSTYSSEFVAKAANAVEALTLKPAAASIIVVEVDVAGHEDPQSMRRWLIPKVEALVAWYRHAEGESPQ